MKILIIGAGPTGTALAETLVAERENVTIVDTDERRLQTLRDRLDLRAVLGDATLPSVLQAALAGDADLLLAVTHSDHVNLCVCRVAQTLFDIPTKIAILRAPDYAEHPDLLGPDSFAVDRSICPEQIFADYIARLIEHPAASQILQFGEGVLSLATLRVVKDSVLAARRIGEIPQVVPGLEFSIPAMVRDNRTARTGADTFIEAGDELFCLAASRDIQEVLRRLAGKVAPCKRILIAGGGSAGLRLAKATEGKYLV